MSDHFPYIVVKLLRILDFRRLLLRLGLVKPWVRSDSGHFIFDVTDTEFCHPGDVMMLLPLVDTALQRNIGVSICAKGRNSAILTGLGYVVVADNLLEFPKAVRIYTLWSSRFSLSRILKGRDYAVDFFRPPEHLLPVSDAFALDIFKSRANYIPSQRFRCDNIPEAKPYLVINFEVFGSKFRITQNVVEEFSELLHRVAVSYDITLIYFVGLDYNTKVDLEESVVDLMVDLRGRLTIQGLIDLIHNPSCLAVCSLDNFVSHLAFRFRKDCYVVPRAFSKATKNYVLSSLFPCSLIYLKQGL